MTNELNYLRERALVLKKDIEELLSATGLNYDWGRAGQIASNMESEVCRIKWALEVTNGGENIDHYQRAVEIYEIIEILLING